MNTITNYESLEDALSFCIRASNKEIKQVAAALWPSDRIETSYPRLIEALNPDKRTKLSMDEVIFIMNFCGRYDALYYMSDRCLHERPAIRSVEAEQKQFTEEVRSMMEQATKAYQHIIKLTKERENIEKMREGMSNVLDLDRMTG